MPDLTIEYAAAPPPQPSPASGRGSPTGSLDAQLVSLQGKLAAPSAVHSLSRLRAGLSHMAEGGHEEGIVPASPLDFAAQGCAVWVSSQDVESEPTQDGEVLWSVVLPCPIAILGEMDVKYPMELVLDAPMAAGDVQQPLGRHVFGQEIVAHDRGVGTLPPQVPARGDPAHRRGAWKAIEGSQAGIAHDGRAPRFAPIVDGPVDLLGDTALARSGKLLRNRSEQAPAVGLDRQNIVAAALAHRRCKGTVAMQRVGGNDAAFEGEKVQHFQSTRRLVAASRFLLGQSHAGIHRKDVDQLQRRGFPAAFISSTQGLAVDSHHPSEFEPIGLGKGRHEAAESLFEGLRLEQTEYPAERVVARNAVLQAQEIRQLPKGLPEPLHPTPSIIRESSSESVCLLNAIAGENAYAIPLPLAGRGRIASAMRSVVRCNPGEGVQGSR